METMHLIGSSLTFNVREELQQLRATEQGKAGAARKTLVRYPDFRIDLITLNDGITIGWHANPGRVSVQCVAGLIRMHTESGDFDLPAGEVLVLDHGIGHDVEARHDSAFLVTIARPHADVPALFNTGRWLMPSRETSVPRPADKWVEAVNAYAGSSRA